MGNGCRGAWASLSAGYLVSDPAKTIRERLTPDKGFLTIKGLSVGAARPEFEYAIPREEAAELLERFCTAVVSKLRYKVQHEGKCWEVDEFLGDNEGLLVAEIELEREGEYFVLPEWVGNEVT